MQRVSTDAVTPCAAAAVAEEARVKLPVPSSLLPDAEANLTLAVTHLLSALKQCPAGKVWDLDMAHAHPLRNLHPFCVDPAFSLGTMPLVTFQRRQAAID